MRRRTRRKGQGGGIGDSGKGDRQIDGRGKER